MERLRLFFPINLKKIREHWKRKGARQDLFAGYTRTMIQTYEDPRRVDAPFDLVLWVSENTGIDCHSLLTREVLLDEIPTLPLFDKSANTTEEEMLDRKEARRLKR